MKFSLWRKALDASRRALPSPLGTGLRRRYLHEPNTHRLVVGVVFVGRPNHLVDDLHALRHERSELLVPEAVLIEVNETAAVGWDVGAVEVAHDDSVAHLGGWNGHGLSVGPHQWILAVDPPLVLHQQLYRTVVTVGLVLAQNARDVSREKALFKVTQARSNRVGAGRASGRRLSIPQAEVVRIMGDVRGCVEVGDLGNEGNLSEVEASDDDGQSLVGPR